MNQKNDWKYKIFLFIPGFLLLAAILNLPYYYYTFLRTFIFISCGFIIFIQHEDKGYLSFIIKLLFVCIALLFNPFAPFHFRKEIWIFIDILCALSFFGYPIVLTIHERNHKRHL